MTNVLKLWRPTRHYGRLLSEGRNRPAPSVGSPSLIWHLAIWRNRIKGEGGYGATSTKINVQKYLEHNREFFGEISHFLRRLQDKGLVWRCAPQDINLEKIPIPAANNDGTETFERFEAFLPQSMNFELWWLDDANEGNLNKRLNPDTAKKEEIDGATRVFVQFQSFQDHVTCTFYLDIAHKYDGTQILDADKLTKCGNRKQKIGALLHTIRKASLGQVKSGAVNAPERISCNDNAIPAELRVEPEELRGAVEYLYDKIWEEFQGAFGFQLSQFGAEEFNFGSVFVNLRGLLISHQGLETPVDQERRDQIVRLKELNDIPQWGAEEAAEEAVAGKRPWKPSERAAGDTLGPVDLFDEGSSEAEVVLRSFGPFLEEMSPGVPDRDWVGCAILDWRGIFVSPLGSRSEVSVDTVGRPLSEPTIRHWPERFLILSKGEPNRQQFGRMIERVTSLETIRTFALRNLGLIQNCYHYLGVLTFELDNILKFWNERRQLLKKKFNIKRSGDALELNLQELEDYVDHEILEIDKARVEPDNATIIRDDQKERLYYELLSLLNESIEKKLIEITADMEGMGPKGSGHVLQDIQHAVYYIDEFSRMVDSLEIGNLHGWLNYKQFADRGMRPTFNMIQKAGDRLKGAQERIKALTDVIQVSGLIVQSDATRRNTAVLRGIASDTKDQRDEVEQLRKETALFQKKMTKIYWAIQIGFNAIVVAGVGGVALLVWKFLNL
jgi:hypothetical protein